MNTTFNEVYAATVKATSIAQPWFLQSLVWGAAVRVCNSYIRSIQAEEEVSYYASTFERTGLEADAMSMEMAKQHLTRNEDDLFENGMALSWWWKAMPIDLEDVIRLVTGTGTRGKLDTDLYKEMVALMGVDLLTAEDKLSKKEKESKKKFVRIQRDNTNSMRATLKMYAGKGKPTREISERVSAWAAKKLAEKGLKHPHSLSKMVFWSAQAAASYKKVGKEQQAAEKLAESTAAALDVKELIAEADFFETAIAEVDVWYIEQRKDYQEDIDHGIVKPDVNYI